MSQKRVNTQIPIPFDSVHIDFGWRCCFPKDPLGVSTPASWLTLWAFLVAGAAGVLRLRPSISFHASSSFANSSGAGTCPAMSNKNSAIRETAR